MEEAYPAQAEIIYLLHGHAHGIYLLSIRMGDRNLKKTSGWRLLVSGNDEGNSKPDGYIRRIHPALYFF